MTLAKAATSLGGLNGLKFRRHVKRIPHKSDDTFSPFFTRLDRVVSWEYSRESKFNQEDKSMVSHDLHLKN